MGNSDKANAMNMQYLYAGKKTTAKMLLNLPVNEVAQKKKTSTAVPYQPPRDETERKLQEMWQTLLKVERIGINDDFVKSGGNSLKAVTLVSRISREFQVELPLGDIFSNRTIRKLAELIKAAEPAIHSPVEPAEEMEYYPLSSAQKRLYILQQMQPDSTGYNMPKVLELEGEPDKERLEQTFKRLIQRHESLRTSFEMLNGDPVQQVHTLVEFEMDYPDINQGPEPAVHHFVRPFDLSIAPLLRVGLVKMGEGKSLLMVDMHHIISDGVSHQILVKEFMQLYEEKDLAPLNLRYKDFAQWQNREKGKERLQHQEAYWIEQLGEELPVLDLPLDYPRPMVRSFEGASADFEMSGETTRKLKEIAQGEDATLFMVLVAIYNILLAKICNQEAVVIGTPTAGRRHADLEPVIGMFVNTLVLKNEPAAGKTFKGLLADVKKQTLEAMENQDYQFEDLVERLAVNRNTSRNPIFDVVFVLQNMIEEEPAQAMVPLKVKPYVFETHISKFDLVLTGSESREGLYFWFQYSTHLFKKESIQRFIDYFKTIAAAVTADPGKKLSGIEVVTGEEKQQLLFEFNNTEAGYPRDKTIHTIFAEQAKRTPDSIAINRVHRNYRTYMTYNQLNKKSNQLAHILQEKGVTPDTIVAMKMEPSMEMIAGILGILKAGGVYLPIDPKLPEQRIRYMLEDSNAAVLLSEVNGDIEVVDFVKNIGPIGPIRPVKNGLPSQLAYVIYTSGTTGKPKGALISHKNVVRLLFNDSFSGLFDFNSSDTWTLFHSYNFDFSVWEMYGALLYGGKLVIISRMTARDPGKFLEILETEAVTVLNQTPSAFYHLADEALNQSTRNLRLRYIIFGGEALNSIQLKKWKERYPEAKLINMFGITETTVHVTYKEITDFEIRNNISNIGKPIPTLTTYVMDRDRHLVPIGTAGELYVGGEGLARGYLNNPELTISKFQAPAGHPPGHPLSFSASQLLSFSLYRTGDLVRLKENGDMEYLGRLDHQVQVRGFRVELGEIESRLLKHEEIKEAVVLARQDQKGEEAIFAYIVPHTGSSTLLQVSHLREYLSAYLPDYMIPAYFVHLEKIPLTGNGKVDRKRLPAPEIKSGEHFTAPKTETEKIIAGIWQDVLGVDKVGAEDNFFEIGGNSLLVVKVNTRLKEVFKKKIPVAVHFMHVTAAALARYIEEGEKGEEIDRSREIESGKRRLQQLAGLEVAVIGMAGRFPGAGNIHEFWENLKNGVESVTFFSDEELEEDGVPSGTLADAGYVKAKGYLQDREYFDASFFGYMPTEARIMDPQIRLMHECAWEALEDAGYDARAYKGLIGLYAGAGSNFYWEAAAALASRGDAADNFLAAQLKDKDYLSTHVAFKLGLKGPAVTVQSACSTSLVAIDDACRALLTGNCDMALAGGVSAGYAGKTGYIYREGMIDSPDGHCRAFDARASGTISGEGVGVVVLKRLEDATKDSDFIYAVVKGFAVNNDGMEKAGFTAPGTAGQAAVIRTAQQMAGIDAESIGYVETHGTGTPLGDTVEVEALKLAFNTAKKGFCAIGSVKTNMGHLDAAAGVTGFIKTALALRHRKIPPSLHFHTPNPKIDFENSPFYVVSQLTNWENGSQPLWAGVSSFGIGGTNAHVVLEEWPGVNTAIKSRGSGGACPPVEREKHQLILLSAKTPSALEKQTENLAEFLKKNPGLNLEDTAYTLQVGRQSFPHRRVLVCSDAAEAVEILTSFKDASSPLSRKVKTFFSREKNRPVVFMLAGLGSQYTNMGLELYETIPLFREEMDRCFAVLKGLMGHDIKEILYRSDRIDRINRSYRSYINQTECAQAVIFAIEYALAKLLMKWGIKPDIMIGYSFGEYAAACLSGVFSLEDVVKLITARGKLIQALPEGVMLSVPLTRDEVEPLLNRELSIAIDNGPSCIVAGPPDAVASFEKQMKERRLLCMRLKTSHAIHSRMMDPILEQFKEKVSSVTLNKPQIPFISNVTGKRITGEQAIDPGYWSAHLRETVDFAGGMRELVKEAGAIFIEIGPGRDLSALAVRHIGGSAEHRVMNLVRHQETKGSDVYYLLNRIGALWLYGQSIDWEAFHSGETRHRVPLPTYPFERQRYWIDGEPFKLAANSQADREKDMTDWFYLPTWKRTVSPLELDLEDETGGVCWLMFADGCGTGKKVADKLRQKGFDTVTVKKGETFARVAEWTYTLDVCQQSDYNALIEDLITRRIAPKGIAHFWSVTTGKVPFNQHQDSGFYSLLFLVQALEKQGALSPIDGESESLQLMAVTNHVFAVTGEEDTCPAKATILGMCKTIPLEYGNIACRSIDIVLPREGSWQETALIDQLAAEFLYKTQDQTVAYRGNSRWVQDFDAFPLEHKEERPKRLKEKGVYLITGGLGRDSLVRARYLAEKAKARLVLTGRSGLPDSKRKIIRELEELGAEVLVILADVANEEDMQRVMNRIDERFGRLDGVIHAAGITTIDSSVTLSELGREQCEWHFRPKVYGLYVLEKVLAGRDIDFCLLTSSIASVIGGGGLAAYTAASIFMDAFSHWKNQSYPNAVPWIALNWEGAPPQETAEAFQRILSLGTVPQVLVSRVDLDYRIKKRLRPETQPNEAEEESTGAAPLHRRPDLLSTYAAPSNETEQELARMWETFFGIQPVGIEDDFIELSGDSLKAIGMIAKIHKAFHVKLSLAEFFKKPVIKDIANYIDNVAADEYLSIEPVEMKEYYPVSSAQKRLFILSEAEGISTTYNVPQFQVLEGQPNKAGFEKAVSALIQRHESLRTSFRLVEGEPVQRIHKEVAFAIEFQEKVPFVRPFDLACAPLLRMALIRVEEEKYQLMLDTHHIISDGVSMEILVEEFIRLYKGETLEALPLQYKDFSEWQNRLFQSEHFKEQEKYWLQEQFEEEVPVLTMPLDYLRPQRRTFDGSTVMHTIPAAVGERLQVFARERNITLNILFFTAYTLLISKYSAQDDIVVGSLVAGRGHADLERVLGLFINFLPIRNRVPTDHTFEEFLDAVGSTVLNAYENQDYPFESIVENLGISTPPSRNPLFDTMLVFHNEVESNIQTGIEDFKIVEKRFGNANAALDFKLDVHMADSRQLNLVIEYNVNLFKEETIKKFLSNLEGLLDTVTREPGLKLSEICLFNEDEEQLLKEKRALNAVSALKPLSLAISATFTSEPVKEHIRWWGKQFGLDIDVTFAPYHQVFQQLLDETGLLSANEGMNVLLVRFEDWIRETGDVSDEEKYRQMEQHFLQLAAILEQKEKRIPYLVGVFPSSTHLGFSPDLVKRLEELNKQWSQTLRQMYNVQAVDFRGLKEVYEVREIFDPLADREGHVPFSDTFFAAVGAEVAKRIIGPHPLLERNYTAAELLRLASEQSFDRETVSKPVAYAAPENEVERKLQEMWQTRLRIENIGINHDYFALGGDSLKAIALVSAVHKEFKVELHLKDIFDNPTIKQLARLISVSGQTLYSTIEPAASKEYYPLSAAQRRLYILSEMEGIGTAYNTPGLMTIEGNLDLERFEETIQALIRRHESFRTSFEIYKGQPIQKVHEEVEFSIEYQDKVPEAAEGLAPLSVRAFDLSKPPLLRVTLLRLEEEKYRLMFDMHHIISDGMSMGILVEEFIKLYKGDQLPPLRIQYKDFSQWQNQLFYSDRFKEQEKYWLEDQFSGEIPVLNMPLDFERPANRTFAGHSVSHIIEPGMVDQLNVLARQRKVTLNILLFAAYNLLLSKYSGQEDIVVGSLAAGRRHADLEHVMGMFGNFLAVRNRVCQEYSFETLLNHVKKVMLAAYENQDYPFDKLVENLNLSTFTPASRNPLFDTMLVFQNRDSASVDSGIEGLRFTVETMEDTTATLDFKLDVFTPPAASVEESGPLYLELQYNIRLFKEETMKRMLRHFDTLLKTIIRNLAAKVSEIQLFSAEEAEALLQKRALDPVTCIKPLSLAVSATFTSEPIRNYIRWWGKQCGLAIDTAFAPYNQVFQQLLDDSSLLSANRGINLLLIRFEDWIREDLPSVPEKEKMERIEAHFAQLMEILRSKEKAIPYMVTVFPVSTHLGFGSPMKRFLGNLYARWRDKLEGMDNIHIIDSRELARLYPVQEIFNPVTDREGHVPFSDAYYAALGTMTARKIHQLTVNNNDLLAAVFDRRTYTAEELVSLPVHEVEMGLLERKPYAAPRNETEQILKEIWESLLRVDKIGIDDEYFQLGGNSLNAVLLVSKVHEAFNVELRLNHVFAHSTIRKLARLIGETEETGYTAIPPAQEMEYYPISPAQRSLNVLPQEKIERTGSNLPVVFQLEGELNRTRLEETFKKLIERHESFRTSFHMIDGTPVQKIHDEVEFSIDFKNKVSKNFAKKFACPFDLSRAPLLRAGLIKVEAEKHLLMVDIHPIIDDGTSFRLFIKEFMLLYSGVELPALKTRYRDYSLWQNSEAKREDLKKQETYWVEQFKGEIPLLDLPTDFPRPEIENDAGDVVDFELDSETAGALKQVALEENATLYMILLAVYNVLLSRLSRQEDIVVGTPVASRTHADLQHIIGRFANTTALRNYPEAGKTFREFLQEVREHTLQAFENQEYRLRDLVDMLGIRDKHPTHNPLFDATFALQNIVVGTPEAPPQASPGDMPDLAVSFYPLEENRSKYDLVLNGREEGERLHFSLRYRTALFKKDTIQRFIAQFIRIVSLVLEDPARKISDIEEKEIRN